MDKNSQTPVIGIVAEYNPFHNGHALHMARARELLKTRETGEARETGKTGAPVVVVLSSSFTQRGFPTLADKWARARMALANGADLVLELPFAYACAAAPEFAQGAVDTLAALNFVTHISFGMEGFERERFERERFEREGLERSQGLGLEKFGNIGTKKASPSFASSLSALSALSPSASSRLASASSASTVSASAILASAIGAVANILIHESCAFKRDLKKNLSEGKSYPKAIAETLDHALPGSGAFVSAPNNSMALSYLLRILEKNYSMKILPVQREGAGYRDEGIPTGAAAIRSGLSRLRDESRDESQNELQDESQDESWIQKAMPASVLDLLKEERQRGRLWTQTEKLWVLLQGLLARSSPEELRGYAGMSEGLENLFLKRYVKADSYEDFIGRCVCARYTRNRLQRQAARCLVGFDRWTLALSRSGPPYIRVLGYNTRGRGLLRLRKQFRYASSMIPVITRLSAAETPAARALAALEFRASRFRELLLSRPDLSYEERQKPAVLP